MLDVGLKMERAQPIFSLTYCDQLFSILSGVARQIGQAGGQAIFTPTPPLEALRQLCFLLLQMSLDERRISGIQGQSGGPTYIYI